MTEFAEVYDLLAKQIARGSGLEATVGPSVIKKPNPVATVEPGRIRMRRETQGDTDEPHLVFACMVKLEVSVAGPGTGLTAAVAASSALALFFDDGYLDLEDEAGDPIEGCSVEARPLDDATGISESEVEERMFLFSDIYAVTVTAPAEAFEET